VHNEHVRATGATRVLQLWVTLAEKDRAAPPRFEVIRAAGLPVHRAPGVEARLYSGRTNGESSPTHNYVPVTLIDLRLDPGAVFEQELPGSYNGFLLPLSGGVVVADDGDALQKGEIGWLDRNAGNTSTVLRIQADRNGARVLLYAGERQNETTLQHGPFVAGSLAELERLFREYRAGRFARISELARATSAAASPA
jgi:redox-sensitive bicupin YhaK (pirin superfamily)